MDASEVGVGALLSQHQGNPQKLYPCAYYSIKLSPAERNYDVGDRELLAVKLALDEWRHWMEGAKDPFVILTDHQNLVHMDSEVTEPSPSQVGPFIHQIRFHADISPR